MLRRLARQRTGLPFGGFSFRHHANDFHGCDQMTIARVSAMSAPALNDASAVAVSASAVDIYVVVAVLAGECVADEIERSVGSAETVSDDIPVRFGRCDYVVRYVHGVCHRVIKPCRLPSVKPETKETPGKLITGGFSMVGTTQAT